MRVVGPRVRVQSSAPHTACPAGGGAEALLTGRAGGRGSQLCKAGLLVPSGLNGTK